MSHRTPEHNTIPWHDPETNLVHLLPAPVAHARAGLDALLEQWEECMQQLLTTQAPPELYRLAFDTLDAMQTMTIHAAINGEPD